MDALLAIGIVYGGLLIFGLVIYFLPSHKPDATPNTITPQKA